MNKTDRRNTDTTAARAAAQATYARRRAQKAAEQAVAVIPQLEALGYRVTPPATNQP